MAVAFSSDGSSVFERKLESANLGQANRNVTEIYQLKYCVNWITSRGCKRAALQFPDELLCDASAVEKWLVENTTDVHYFILADTSYGSCCVDEVAAEHYQADCVLHFGHACLSPTRRLPVIYLFNQAEVDGEDCLNKLREALPDTTTKLGVVYDVSYHHAAKALLDRICKEYPNTVCSELNIAENAFIPGPCDCDPVCQCANNDNLKKEKLSKHTEKSESNSHFCANCGPRTLKIPHKNELEHYTLLYIGSEGVTLNNLMMNWNKCIFYSYNPENKTCRKESLNVNKALMKRYYFVEKIKDANIVGILVGTLGVANYLQAMDRLKELLKKVGKKYYTFVVGKLNVAKLANFMEIDVYVYVSCPENTMVDSADFYRPIVTPYEVELACNPDREWAGECVTDFQQILPGGQSYIAFPEDTIEQTTDVSLVTGGMRKLGVTEDTEITGFTALVERGNNLKVAITGAQNAGEFLHSREWQGLEPDLGKTPVTKAVEGRKGIAISYEEEPKS